MVTLKITLIPHEEIKDHNRVSLSIENNSDKLVSFQEVISAMIAITDQLISEQKKLQNEQSDLQLGESSPEA